ncbi:MAG: preprotein translocase subunit SecE [Acutalibacteraceae bacterium]|nr:preprotein translocase subunit SecE [Acutalibacteraceae bacterium]
MAKDQNSEAAKKVADAEKASKKSAKKDGNPNIIVRIAKAIAKFFKDLKGENKKIVWPNGKTVLKNTGIVLIVVLVVGVPIWLFDWGASEGLNALLAIEPNATTEAVTGEVSTTANSAVKPSTPASTAATTTQANAEATTAAPATTVAQ